MPDRERHVVLDVGAGRRLNPSLELLATEPPPQRLKVTRPALLIVWQCPHHRAGCWLGQGWEWSAQLRDEVRGDIGSHHGPKPETPTTTRLSSA